MALIPRLRAGFFVLLPALTLLIPLVLPDNILSRSRTTHLTSSHQEEDGREISDMTVASSSAANITRGLWVGTEKSLLALSLETGQSELAVPVEQLLDVAVDNGRSIVWIGTKKEVIQFGFDGSELFRYSLYTGDHEDESKNSRRDDHHDSIDHRTNDRDNATDEQDDDSNESTVHLSLDPSDGSLWIGAGHDVIRLSRDGSELFRVQEHGKIIDLAVDTSSHTCWVVRKHRITNYGIDSTILLDFDIDTDHELIALTPESSTGSLWIGTAKGLIKVDASGHELFRISGPEHVQDLKANAATDDLWVITKKKAYKYSKDGEKLLTVSLCHKEEGDDDSTAKEQISKKSDDSTTDCSDGEDGHDNDDDKDDNKNCTGNLAALAVDANDNTCWVATRKTLYKLSDTGEILLKLKGFKQVQALDIGSPSGGKGPELLLCAWGFNESVPPLPSPECNKQVYVTGFVDVTGWVDDTAETVTLNGSPIDTSDYIWAGRYGSEGEFAYTAVATNAAGVSSTATVTIVTDKHAPVITITSPQDGMVTKDLTITLTGTVEDPNLDRAYFFLSGSNVPMTSNAFSVPCTLYPFDGLNSFWILVGDLAGNSSIKWFSVILDTTAPQLVITAPADSSYTNSATLSISGTSTDENPDSITVSVNNDPAQQMNFDGTNFSGTAAIQNKTNTVQIQAKDKAGNTTTTTETVYLDQDPPLASITAPAPDSSLTGTVQISATATDSSSGIASVNLLIDSKITATQTQAPYTVQIDTFMYSAGPHTITVRATDKAGNRTEASIPVTIQGQFGINITSPATGTTINKSSAIVKGTITMPEGGEIGVTINGIPAQQQGTDFAAIVPLQAGQNTITAIATNIYGVQEQAGITINTDSAQESMRLTATPTSGIMTTKADGTTSFSATLSIETYLTNTIQSYNWNINGDGAPDQTGDLLSQVTGTYQAPGLYFPSVLITDTMGNNYTETTIVNVIDKAAIDALLQAKWGGMKTSLMNGDVEGAVGWFLPDSQDKYRSAFTTLKDSMANIALDMQNIEINNIRETLAKYRIKRDQNVNGQQQTITYYIYFVKDQYGLWKIDEF